MRVYLDCCALNRLADEQTQARVRDEARAVEQILRMIFLGQVEWVSSIALEMELGRNPNVEKRRDVLALLAHAPASVGPPADVEARAESLRLLGYGTYDALHLACAEWQQAEVLVTTDDRFCGLARRGIGGPRVRVLNPVDWMSEVKHGTG